ncbi:MAG: TonB-dependent receptor [Bacteroidota bacterium]
MNKHYCLILLFVILGINNINAQTGTLKGNVNDSKTNLPLIGVNVILDDNASSSTDYNGNYEIKMKEGEHKVAFHFVGYAEQTKKISIKDGETMTINVSLYEAEALLKTMVVTASRYEQDIKDVTISMQVLKPYLIANKNTTSMETAIDQIPGVNVVDNQVSIRGGSGWSYGAGSRVFVLLDGMPFQTADAGDIKWSFIPVENIEQVEVIAGASSAIYGGYALNGIINIRTGFPRDTPITKINVFEGIYDKPKNHQLVWWGTTEPTTMGTNFYHSQKFKQFDVVLGGNIFNDGGYRQGEVEQRIRFNGNTRYRFKDIPGLTIGLNFNMQYAQGGNFLLWANDTTGAYKPYGGIDSSSSTLSKYTTKRLYIDPNLTYVDKEGNTHKLLTRYLNTTNLNNTNQESQGGYYSGEYIYTRKLKNINAFLTVGAMIAKYNVSSDSLYGNHQTHGWGGYWQLDKKIKKLAISIGTRTEYYDIDPAHKVSNLYYNIFGHKFLAPLAFRSGMNYQLFENTFVRTSFGNGWRPPTIAEKYIVTHEGSIYIYPNSNLNAEQGWSAELGIKQAIKISNWYGYLDVAAFKTKYTDMMEFTFGQPGPIKDPAHLFGLGFQAQNVGNTTISGLDFSLSGQGKLGPFPTNVMAGFTYMDPHDDNTDSVYIKNKSPMDNFLKYRYKYIAKADVEMSYKKFSVGASMRYNSFMHSIDSVFNGKLGGIMPALQDVQDYRSKHNYGDYFIDARTSYQASTQSKVAFIVKNLLNREAMSRPADMLPPRSFVIQYTLAF